MAKGKSQALGITAMIVVLVVVVALSATVMRYIFRSMSGFEDVKVDAPIQALTGVRASDVQLNYPDPNTGYYCRSPNGSGVPCPEGQFCDGPTQSCLPTFVDNTRNGIRDGYYS
jgi:hypothetical protein